MKHLILLSKQNKQYYTTINNRYNIKLSNNFLDTLNNQSNLLEKLDINKHIVNAIKIADNMLDSLPDGNLIKLFILSEIYKPVKVKASINSNKIIPNDLVYFKSNKIPNNISTNAGVYVYTHNVTGEQYVGSAMNLKIRLGNHKDQFMKLRDQDYLHKTVNNNGGLSSLNWGVVYSTGGAGWPFRPPGTSNLLTEFIKNNPKYLLTKGEVDILVHFTHLKPRILEQSLMTYFKPKLNGKSAIVLYQYTSWNPKLLSEDRKTDFFSKAIEIRLINELLMTVPSMNTAAITLGVSRERVRLYLD